MASALTLPQLYERIVQQDEARLDIIADTRSMSTTAEPGKLLLHADTQDGVESFLLNDHARSQLATEQGIPKKYFDRMLAEAPGLLVSNVDHWLHNAPERRMVRGFRNGDGSTSTGRAYLSDKYRRLDHIEIARRVFPVFAELDGLKFHQAQITDTKLYVRAVLPRLEAEVKVGDVVQMGVEIGNSEVGSGALYAVPFILRLICTNGMTINDAKVRKLHVGKRITDESFYSDEALNADDEAFWLAFRDTVKHTLTEVRFNEIVTQLQSTTTGDRIAAPIAMTEQLQSRYSLTDDEREKVLRSLVSEGDMTQWGLLNAVTAAAKEVDDFDRQAELEGLGWEIGSLDTKAWAQLATV